MKKTILSLFVLCIIHITTFAQSEVEGKITALNMQTITIVLNEVPTSTLKSKEVEVIKKFNLSETFPNMKGEGTMNLAQGIISQHNGKTLVVKVSKYYSTKVENGVQQPMAKVGNKTLLKFK